MQKTTKYSDIKAASVPLFKVSNPLFSRSEAFKTSFKFPALRIKTSHRRTPACVRSSVVGFKTENQKKGQKSTVNFDQTIFKLIQSNITRSKQIKTI